MGNRAGGLMPAHTRKQLLNCGRVFRVGGGGGVTFGLTGDAASAAATASRVTRARKLSRAKVHPGGAISVKVWCRPNAGS